MTWDLTIQLTRKGRERQRYRRFDDVVLESGEDHGALVVTARTGERVAARLSHAVVRPHPNGLRISGVDTVGARRVYQEWRLTPHDDGRPAQPSLF